ncbi:MAG: molybdopterin cofactor-binding domain-containing protein [Pseudomonadota bacterium]
MSRLARIARRSFLVGSAAVVGGVAFGAYYVNRPIPNPLLDDLEDGEAAITPFVKITEQAITLIVPRSDVGQGIMSTQAHLIAEELDVDPAKVRLDPGQPHPAYANAKVASAGLPFQPLDKSFVPKTVRELVEVVATVTGAQFTGGSSSVSDLHERLRTAGAVARETLKAAAARRTGHSIASLDTADGHVLLPDGARIAYTALAKEAAETEPVVDVALRPPEQWRRLGKPLRRIDIISKSTGTQDYGIDVRLPDMLHATVRGNPGRGGGVGQYDASRALKMRGVRTVAKVTDGIAVIADNTWRAFQAAQTIEVEWSAPDYPASSEEMWQVLEASEVDENLNSRLREDGDVDGAVERHTAVTAEYRVPYLAHAPLEPLNATVLVETDRVTIWTATQIPHTVRDAAAAITGRDAGQVIVQALPAGGSFGRRLDHDFAIQAIEIAAAVPGIPVKTTWSREADMAQGFPRPMHLARGRGAVADGKVIGFDLSSISPSLADSWFGRIFIVPPGPDTLLVWGAYDQPFAIPNYRVSGYKAPQLAPIGSWRSPGACSNAFFHESLMSELIHAAGADPLEERLRLVSDPVSRGVLEAVGEMSGWSGSSIGPGRGRGLAFCHSHHVPAAEVIDVTLTDEGIRIDEVWIAADCGKVLDPVNAEAQLTGAAIFGLGHAMNCEITYENHAAVQSNYHEYEGMRLSQAPRLHTRLLEQASEIRGLGEPATPPAAPALAEALFGATGKRIRELPFNKHVEFL